MREPVEAGQASRAGSLSLRPPAHLPLGQGFSAPSPWAAPGASCRQAQHREGGKDTLAMEEPDRLHRQHVSQVVKFNVDSDKSW